ncbi:unnamed protein product [Brachionus calyciflorus]|uniref:EF-hand domain-containing protein n=1 Tax=Brachionus calyciflorus TaxID=104777 RepID=A0A814IWN4_9BILA|nr:unnamed protein product [Brachionus calyciflorus]
MDQFFNRSFHGPSGFTPNPGFGPAPPSFFLGTSSFPPMMGGFAPYAQPVPPFADQNVFTILQAFDKDGNGVITESDFVIAAYQNGYGHLGEMAARNTFRQLDTNRNGLLDIHEAVNAFAILKGMSPENLKKNKIVS